MIHRINVFLLSVIIAFAPAYAFAANAPWDYDYKKQGRWAAQFKSIIGEDQYYKTIAARGEKDLVVNGTRQTISSTATARVSAAEVGSVMSKRLKSAAGGGGAILGVFAVQALLEGIGWIMEDGIYVKKRTDDGGLASPADQYIYSIAGLEGTYSTGDAACSAYNAKNGNGWWGGTKYDAAKSGCIGVGSGTKIANVSKKLNSNYDPNAPKPSERTIQITDQQIGCAIFHTCYQDPVDPSIDTTVNTGVSDDETIKNAATPDEKAGETDQTNPITKKVNEALENGDKTKEKEGTDGKTESTTEKTTDENGNEKEVTKGDFKLPAFCDWATYMCEWIDWTKEDDLPEKDDTDFEDDSPIVQKQVSVNFGSECPAPASVSYTVKGRTESIQVVNFEYVCAQAPIIKPSIIALASIGAAFIVFGRGREQ